MPWRVRLVGSVGLTWLALATPGNLSAESIPDQYRQNGFAIGCQAYTFNRYSVFEAIEKTAEAGGKVIEFFPGQKLSQDEPKIPWDHNASDQVIAKVEAKLQKHGIKAVNYGVVMPTSKTESAEAEWRRIFQFAK